jgi:hypothetical protein
MSAPARKFSANVVHAIRGRVAYNTAGSGVGVEIGTIPAGSFVDTPIINVETAFNAGTTNTVTVGSAGTPALLASSADVAPTATGYKTGSGAGRGNITADTPVVVTYTQAGTAATAGVVDVLIRYYPFPS